MLSAYKISPLGLLATVLLLAIGEIACGTSLFFATMMTIALLSIGMTYNLLGGLATFSGIIFSGFALRTIVISQFAKVLLLEPADSNLQVPELTIAVYAAFFTSGMVGAYIFGSVRLRLPKVAEPRTNRDANALYFVSLLVGIVATVILETYSNTYGSTSEDRFDQARSISVAFSPLLLLALVTAVSLRIKRTNGAHSFGWMAFIPWLAGVSFAFIDTIRTSFLTPTVVYFAACYVNGYKFGRRHYIMVIVGVLLFLEVISPLLLYTRNLTGDLSLSERAQAVFLAIRGIRNISEVQTVVVENIETSENREAYYSNPALFTLSRLSIIRADSNLIASCSSGNHYGLTAMWGDFSRMLPFFIFKNKSQVGGENYLGHVTGTTNDEDEKTQIEFSAVADSYGGFGWLGVVIFPLFGLPLVYVVCESMFGDIKQPWATAALGTVFLVFGEMNMGRLAPIVIRIPVVILLLSRLVSIACHLVPLPESTRGNLGGSESSV